jgi:thioredoxin reductase (NADPH)
MGIHEVIIVGGGPAGLSAAIYLGRAKRDTLVIDSGKAMARWEPDIQNYLGFPEGLSGDALIDRGRAHAERFGAQFVEDEIVNATSSKGVFSAEGRRGVYQAKRLLLATGIYHLPPDIEGVNECLGHSMFFCKDCDGVRVEGKTVGIYGWRNETVEYALGMLLYSPTVAIVTDGREPKWDAQHQSWVHAYCIPVYGSEVRKVSRDGGQLESLALADGTEVKFDALFTTRGDVYFNRLAKALGAEIDDDGEILVNDCQATNIPGLYAAGCVTPANCQIIIAAGQGAVAAQAINRDLFEESLATHSLRRFRQVQMQEEQIAPEISFEHEDKGR